MIHLWISGMNGRMGQCIRACAEKTSGFRLLAGHDADTNPETICEGLKDAHLVLDFSTEVGSEKLLALLSRATSITNLSVLVGSTGLREEALNRWKALGESPQRNLRILIAPNTSLGILVCKSVTSTLAKLLHPKGYDIEIEETHHRHKKDAPSGTALLLASAAQSGVPGLSLASEPRQKARSPEEIGIHATRGGGVFGEHKVRFLGENDEITLSHRAFHRELFGQGSLLLGGWLHRQRPGFYTLDHVNLEDLN